MEEIDYSKFGPTKTKVVAMVKEYLDPILLGMGYTYLKSKESYKKTINKEVCCKISIVDINYWPYNQNLAMAYRIDYLKVSKIAGKILNQEDFGQIGSRISLPEPLLNGFRELFTENDITEAIKDIGNDTLPQILKAIEYYSKYENFENYFYEYITNIEPHIVYFAYYITGLRIYKQHIFFQQYIELYKKFNPYFVNEIKYEKLLALEEFLISKNLTF